MSHIDASGAAILSTYCMNPTQYQWFSQVRCDEPRILLIQRGATAPQFPEHWAFPAGLRDNGESRENTAKRETFEEVGIDFHPDELFYEAFWENRRMHYFLGSWIAPPAIIVQTDEIAGYGWFSYEDALNLPLAFRYKDVIEYLSSMK